MNKNGFIIIIVIIVVLVILGLCMGGRHRRKKSELYNSHPFDAVLIVELGDGRLGNNIVSTVIAINYALENNFNIIKLPKKTLYCNTEIINIGKYTNVPVTPKSEMFGPFWDHDFYNIHLDKNADMIKKIIRSIYRFPPASHSDDNTLHIHIRGDDAITGMKDNGMVQPPGQYYSDQIEKKQWNKIIIISEDKKNPCVDYILNKYENAQYNKNTLDDDIRQILSAKYICIGRGTFMPALTLFMPNLQKLHYVDDGDDRMHYFLEVFNKNKVTIHREYETYYKKVQLTDDISDVKKLMTDWQHPSTTDVIESYTNIIPNIIHFIYGLKPENSNNFLFIYYIGILSAYIINKPKNIYLYYHYEMNGRWFDKLKEDVPILELVKIDIPTHIGNKPIKHVEHMADKIRMEKLIEHGGIYMDMDTISVRPYKHLLNNEVVLGKEKGDYGICNAIMMTIPNSDFFTLWWGEYEKAFEPDGWNEASVRLPRTLANKNPDLLTLLEASAFFLPNYDETQKIFQKKTKRIPKELITQHLWESHARKYIKNIHDWGWADKNNKTLYGKILLSLKHKI